ncbi:MAG: hypothetical protein LBU37_09100 [Tannerellaceae bacterium]|jgi:hypothetical protein|nr:hypothetical protein [Tannerellaceae bacterium]
MLQRGRQVAVWFLMLMFATYYVDVTFFQHSHIINGVTIVHSHFHNKAHPQSGTHSANELTMISTLSDFQSAGVAAFGAVTGLFVLLGAVGGAIPPGGVCLRPAFFFSLRAPPLSF